MARILKDGLFCMRVLNRWYTVQDLLEVSLELGFLTGHESARTIYVSSDYCICVLRLLYVWASELQHVTELNYCVHY